MMTQVLYRIMRRSMRSILLIAVILSFSIISLGQTAGVTGIVKDSAQAVVPGAAVNLVNEDTGIKRTATTNALGYYSIPFITPGNYKLTVQVTGFQTVSRTGIKLEVAQVARLDFTLEIGRVEEEVTVRESVPLLETESAALGRTTSEKFILSLPLSNRNFTQILALSTGTAVELPNAGEVGRNSQNVSANGARTTFNNFEFNGVDANNFSQNSASGFGAVTSLAIPAPDTLQEFKAQTGLYDASKGRGAGANIDIVSKSGTNSLHGTLWEFFRNDKLNANDFFLNRSAQPRPVLKQNQFGFTLGGPVRKEKTFFFGAYQGTTQRNGQSNLGFRTALVPPLTDDRSAATLGKEFVGQSGLFGGVAVAADGSNINPVALKLLNFKLDNGLFAIPTPQTILPGGLGQFSFSSPVKFREDQFTANIDHVVSERNQFSGRLFYADTAEDSPFFRDNLPGFGLNLNNQNVMAVLSDTHTFTSNLINVARVGYIRFHGAQTEPEPIKNSDLGITSPGGLPGIPIIQVLGLFNLGPDLFLTETTNSFVAQDTISIFAGKHSLHVGGEFKRDARTQYQAFLDRGVLIFASFPDFLLGLSGAQNGTGSSSNVLTSILSSGSLEKADRYSNLAGFIQDDIKLTPRLTVNLGLRYEYFGPPSDIRGRLGNFDPSLALPVPAAAGTLTGILLEKNFRGPLPAGVTQRQESGLWNKDHNDFSPRLGFALRLSDKPGLVLRGGYGIYYQRLTGQVAVQSIANLPFAQTDTRSGPANSDATFENPVNPPGPPLSSFPLFIPRTATSTISPVAISTGVRSPYVQQYGLNLQYEFAPDFLLEVGYVGSKGTRLAGNFGFNQALIATPESPVNGVTTTTVANVPQRTPFLGLAAGVSQVQTDFSSNYNSLQTSVTKRLSHGLNFLAGYTWSKSLDVSSGGGAGGLSAFDIGLITNDQTNLRNSYGLSDFDRTHRFVLSFVYQPPELRRGPRPLQFLLSKWQLSGLTVIQSGIPITVVDSTAGTAFGGIQGFARAECTAQDPAGSGSITDRLNGFFNNAAFTTAPIIGDDGIATGFGSCGRGILRAPGQRNLDLAIERSFRIFKESNLLFRAEFFNFTNTPNFGQPNADRASLSFGVISNTVANPRIIQFALKYNF
ncbi:MAG: TonB-dependent receptor domain-containing protein [Pyrinomonadaceae bacterium]